MRDSSIFYAATGNFGKKFNAGIQGIDEFGERFEGLVKLTKD
jgi:hypothetical protein